MERTRHDGGGSLLPHGRDSPLRGPAWLGLGRPRPALPCSADNPHPSHSRVRALLEPTLGITSSGSTRSFSLAENSRVRAEDFKLAASRISLGIFNPHSSPFLFLSLSLPLPLPLALSPPGLTSGSGARPPLSVPGRGAVNGGRGRRSGGHAQPRAPETLDFGSPTTSRRGARGRKGKPRREARGTRPSPEPPPPFPHAELAAAHSRAPPPPAAPGHTSSRPRGEAVPCAVPRRPPRVAGPAPGWCMRGGAAAGPRRRWKA